MLLYNIPLDVKLYTCVKINNTFISSASKQEMLNNNEIIYIVCAGVWLLFNGSVQTSTYCLDLYLLLRPLLIV